MRTDAVHPAAEIEEKDDIESSPRLPNLFIFITTKRKIKEFHK